MREGRGKKGGRVKLFAAMAVVDKTSLRLMIELITKQLALNGLNYARSNKS